MVTELQLYLKGTIELNTPIADLLEAADSPKDPEYSGGVIDAVGF